MTQASRGEYDRGIGGNQSPLTTLDRALEYARDHLFTLLLSYFFAVAPLTLAMLYVIDAVSSQHRSALPVAALLMTLATLWRWLGLAYLQRNVQQDLLGSAVLPVRRRLPAILILRLCTNFLLTWGSVIILLTPPALLLSGFAVPLLLERQDSAWSQTREVLGWMHNATGRLVRISTAVTLMMVLVLIAVIGLQLVGIYVILERLMGYESPDLKMTVFSVAWILSVCYALFLLFDFYWTIACVFIYYDLQAQRMGTDLRRKLIRLAGAPR